MNAKKMNGKARRAGKRGPRDLSARKSGDVGGGSDAKSGLSQGKRDHKPTY
jgi:hypothetical protein